MMVYNQQMRRYEYVPDNAQPQQNKGLLWVSGEAGAKSWVLQPNETAILMDAENNKRFYIKSTDPAGMPTMKTYEYEEVLPKEAAPAPNMDLMNEIENIKAQIEELNLKYLELAPEEGGKDAK